MRRHAGLRGPRKREVRSPDEAARLSAAYLNGIAIALVAVGSFAPTFTALYSGARQPPWVIGTISLICLGLSASLHLLARRFVKGPPQ
jgi:thiol:disulfide interchange protein